MEKVIWIGLKREHMRYHSQTPKVREQINNIEVGDFYGDPPVQIGRIRVGGQLLGIGASIANPIEKVYVEQRVTELFQELGISIPPQIYEDSVP